MKRRFGGEGIIRLIIHFIPSEFFLKYEDISLECNWLSQQADYSKKSAYLFYHILNDNRLNDKFDLFMQLINQSNYIQLSDLVDKILLSLDCTQNNKYQNAEHQLRNVKNRLTGKISYH